MIPPGKTDPETSDVAPDGELPVHGAGDRAIDAVLTRAFAEMAHKDDAGFTDGVMARLPAKSRRRLTRREGALTISALVAGGIGAGAFFGGVPLDLASPAQALALVAVVGLALWGAFASAEA
jgi:hypothetical protein